MTGAAQIARLRWSLRCTPAPPERETQRLAIERWRRSRHSRLDDALARAREEERGRAAVAAVRLRRATENAKLQVQVYADKCKQRSKADARRSDSFTLFWPAHADSVCRGV